MKNHWTKHKIFSAGASLCITSCIMWNPGWPVFRALAEWLSCTSREASTGNLGPTLSSNPQFPLMFPTHAQPEHNCSIRHLSPLIEQEGNFKTIVSPGVLIYCPTTVSTLPSQTLHAVPSPPIAQWRGLLHSIEMLLSSALTKQKSWDPKASQELKESRLKSSQFGSRVLTLNTLTFCLSVFCLTVTLSCTTVSSYLYQDESPR